MLVKDKPLTVFVTPRHKRWAMRCRWAPLPADALAPGLQGVASGFSGCSRTHPSGAMQNAAGEPLSGSHEHERARGRKRITLRDHRYYRA